MRISVVLAALAAAVAATPAASQSWGFGIEMGPGVFFGPPPVVYEAPPAVFYEEPTRVIVPPPRSRVIRTVAPEDVLDRLAGKGYSDFGPVDRRGAIYVLSAADPNGNLVVLDVSIFTGRIEHSRILEARYMAPPTRAPAAKRARAAQPAPAAAPAKPARVPAPKPETASAPAKPATVEPAEEEVDAPTSDGSASSTLRDRLHTPKARPEQTGSEPDPLVVY